MVASGSSGGGSGGGGGDGGAGAMVVAVTIVAVVAATMVPLRMYKGGATAQRLRGTRTIWSRSFPCTAQRNNVKR